MNPARHCRSQNKKGCPIFRVFCEKWEFHLRGPLILLWTLRRPKRTHVGTAAFVHPCGPGSPGRTRRQHPSCRAHERWSPDNFVAPAQEVEEEAEDAVADEPEDEAEDEDTVAAAPALNHVSTEEARMQAQGVVRNWLLESAGGNVEAKSD